MALSVRATKAVRPTAARRSVKVSASLTQAQVAKVAMVGAASLAAAASLAHPAEAANLVSTVASATEGYPFVPPSWAPSVFVPLTGLVIPAIAMATLFVYIEKEAA